MGTQVQVTSASFGRRGIHNRAGPRSRFTLPSWPPPALGLGRTRFSCMSSALAGGGVGGPGLCLTGESTVARPLAAINPSVPGMHQALRDQEKRGKAVSEEARNVLYGNKQSSLAPGAGPCSSHIPCEMPRCETQRGVFFQGGLELSTLRNKEASFMLWGAGGVRTRLPHLSGRSRSVGSDRGRRCLDSLETAEWPEADAGGMGQWGTRSSNQNPAGGGGGGNRWF